MIEKENETNGERSSQKKSNVSEIKNTALSIKEEKENEINGKRSSQKKSNVADIKTTAVSIKVEKENETNDNRSSQKKSNVADIKTAAVSIKVEKENETNDNRSSQKKSNVAEIKTTALSIKVEKENETNGKGSIKKKSNVVEIKKTVPSIMVEKENETNDKRSTKKNSIVSDIKNFDPFIMLQKLTEAHGKRPSNKKSRVSRIKNSAAYSIEEKEFETNDNRSSKKKSHVPEIKNFAPFGVAVQRFATIGFHPGLDPTGSLRKKGGTGPGQYDPNFIECAHKLRKHTKEPWTRKNDTEEFSKTLGYRLPHVLKEREERKKANGPGTLEIDEALFRQQSNNVKKNVYFTTAARWKKPKRPFANPPPGTYGKNHDPYLRWEESRPPVHQWTPLPTFEWDNFIDRFKLGRNEPRTLPPNIYASYRQSGIQQLLAKRVSKRGPYDLFTGPRDERTIKGYFMTSFLKGVKSWPMKLPAEMDRLKQKKRRHYGKFLQCDRFTKNPGLRLMLSDLTMCPKNPDDPGPGHYEVGRPRVFKQNKEAFNQSVLYARPRKKWEILPGVGRYEPKYLKCKGKDKRESWVFKSVAKREFYKIIVYNNF